MLAKQLIRSYFSYSTKRDFTSGSSSSSHIGTVGLNGGSLSIVLNLFLLKDLLITHWIKDKIQLFLIERIMCLVWSISFNSNFSSDYHVIIWADLQNLLVQVYSFYKMLSNFIKKCNVKKSFNIIFNFKAFIETRKCIFHLWTN